MTTKTETIQLLHFAGIEPTTTGTDSLEGSECSEGSDGAEAHPSTSTEKGPMSGVPDQKPSGSDAPTDTFSSKDMMIQKLLNDLKSKKQTQPPRPSDDIIAAPNSKITYSMDELRDLNPLKMSRQMCDRSEIGPPPAIEHVRASYSQLMTSAMASPQEIEVLSALSNQRTVQPTATESVHSDKTIESNESDNLKARLMQRSKNIQAKMRNLTKK